MMSGIVVGVDGSGHSQRALEWAMREAASHHALLTVVTVYQADTSFWRGRTAGPKDGFREHAHARAAEQTDKALTQLGDLEPPSVTIQPVLGMPAEELMKAAGDADMLVVGARGAGGFLRLRLGSASTQLTQQARCPLVIVPPDDDQR